jgi:hypothetical protein
VLDAYLNDPIVIDEMAKNVDLIPRRRKPSLFGWTAQLSALKDIQDQLIASRGGTQFVPRPDVPGHKEGWVRKDTKLSKTIDRIIGPKE